MGLNFLPYTEAEVLENSSEIGKRKDVIENWRKLHKEILMFCAPRLIVIVF